MDDEVAFAQACAAAPIDRVLRLVYADWLEDRGDDRSKYLRLEQEICALHEKREPASNWKPSSLHAAPRSATSGLIWRG